MKEDISQIENCIGYLSEILNTLKSSSWYERVFHLIVYRLALLYKCQTTAIILINPKTEYLNIYNSFGLSQTFCNEFKKNISTGAIAKLLWSGETIMINDRDESEEIRKEFRLEHQFESCLSIQISVDHLTYGYLYLDSVQKNNFSNADINFCKMFADVAGIAFHKHQLHEDNLRLERIDRETGADKYSTFIEKLKFAIERAQKTKEEFTLLLLDVDNFKIIVNTYGSQVAIKMLRQLAEIIKELPVLPFSVGRYGFDEFIVLLENCNLPDAVRYATLLKKRVELTKFSDYGYVSTISIGLSSYPQNATSSDELLVTVKNALYEAQRTGKNKIYYYIKEWYAKEFFAVESV